jgi:hypothetical protein
MFVLGAALAAGALLIAFRSDSGPDDARALERIEASPRPPVVLEEAVPVLLGRGTSPPPDGEVLPAALAPSERPALLDARNEAALAHRDAIARYEAGVASTREVELAELVLLDLRYRLGEIDRGAYFARRIEMLSRDLERFRRLAAAGRVSAADVARAALYVARERYLAGMDDAYVTQRAAFFESVTKGHEALVEAGVASPRETEHLREELESEFPALPLAPTRGR